MPGGRLTYADRRVIVAGLCEGLGYAEIGRRLARPTSTISREVTRNGGPGGYRADRADRDAGRRARRRKPTTPAPSEPPVPDAYGRDPEAVRAFEERLAAMMAQTGLPRMTARVLACLLTSDSNSLTAVDLVRRLGVSPASISKAVGYLEQSGLLGRERDARHRHERYVIDDDLWYRASQRQAQVCELWASSGRLGAEVLGVGTPAGSRLDEMGRFFGLVGRDLSQASEHWRQAFAPNRDDATGHDDGRATPVRAGESPGSGPAEVPPRRAVRGEH